LRKAIVHAAARFHDEDLPSDDDDDDDADADDEDATSHVDDKASALASISTT